jgi:hypothetical protein
MMPDFPFVPSPGVRIEIISGDGCRFEGPPAFKAVVSSHDLNHIYEYDFSTRQTSERTK